MNSVIVKDYLHVQVDYNAAEALTPGHLVELASATTVQNHSTQYGNAAKMFVIEDAVIGAGLSTDIVILEQARVWIPTSGDVVNAVLAINQVIAVGDFLASNGDGTLTKHVPESSDYYEATDVTVKPLQIVGMAIEEVTTTSAVARLQVMIVN